MNRDKIEENCDSFILRNVKAIDQTRFESQILSKVDRAYKKHFDEEKLTIEKKLSETKNRIDFLTRSVKDINESLANHLRSSKCSEEEFVKIRQSLENQIDLKNQELKKLARLKDRYSDQLEAMRISEKFGNDLDQFSPAKSANRSKQDQQSCSNNVATASGSNLRDSQSTSHSASQKPIVIELDSDSGDSLDSSKTEIFDATAERCLDSVEPPIIRKRKFSKRIYMDESPPRKKRQSVISRNNRKSIIDDGDIHEFRDRIDRYKNDKINAVSTISNDTHDNDGKCSSHHDNIDLDRGFVISGAVWSRLYEFQQEGVRWLLRLHCNGAGGILGDEMGLGKTVQVIAFLSGLRRSEGIHFEYGPTLIVCPATVMHQWVEEFREWEPLFRVALLHKTGGGYDRPEALLNSITSQPGVLVTTYSSFLLQHELIARYQWQYVILDEGHKIKNPNARVTICLKKLQTPHRLILSGSPIQNNLKELWSLVDFVYPGKLGSLATFIQNFALPIMKGGYEHASPLQVETAYRCACVIRDTINEYLLRRTKAEVRLQLPQKTEQVLFCGLSDHQNVVYKEYLASKQCKMILSGQQVPFPGLVMLRKICNHPDLVTGGPKFVMNHAQLGFSRESTDDGHGHKFGHFSRSGKMVVVRELLQLWYRGKHKVLLFTQGRLMLQILKRFIEQQGYPFCTMDGTTGISSRHSIVNKFNESPYNELFVFLLTTRVGGLGLNLVGADRVLVFDPDWNPCTDLQARERAWRIGQNRKVVIYRLVISGSVEEKIYHRQVFKQFLTNRILKNPRQRRFFKTQDLRDLFRLDEPGAASDTSIMFRGNKHYKRLSKDNYFDESRDIPLTGCNNDADEDDAPAPDLRDLDIEVINVDEEQQQQTQQPQIDHNPEELAATSFLSEEKLKKLREKARKLSQALSKSMASKEGSKTKVEGELITNVRANKEFKIQEGAAAKTGLAGDDNIVATLVPNKKIGVASAISYSDVCAAEKVADRAKKSLEQTLSKAGVTDRIYHDAVINDVTPDWALVQREAEACAKSGVAWLRNCMLPVRNKGSGDIFGSVKNSFLWDKHEDVLYFENLESSSKSHFSGNSNSNSMSMSKHVRFSSPYILTIIRNRTTHKKTPWDSVVVVNNRVKNLIKNIYLFLTTTCSGGQTTSDVLISHFRDQVTQNNNLLFKGIINELCTFHKLKDSNGGIWRLRAEFND